MNPIPVDVLVERLRARENTKRLVSSSSMCNRMFQSFLSLVLPDLESGTRKEDKVKEKEVKLAAEKAIKEIRSYGFEVRKAEAIEKTSELDIQDYSNQREQIEESIKGVQEEIGALKEGLVVERKKRQNKEIYEETCKDINKYPPHRATRLTIGELEKELVLLQEKTKVVQAVQKIKHKRIALILQSLADIQATVDEGEVDDEGGVGALELVGLDVDDEVVADEDGEGEGDAAAVDRDGDVDGEDEGNDYDGEVEEGGARRRGRKRSPSAESDEGAIRANGGGGIGMPPLSGPPGGGGDVDMPDAA